MTRRIHTVDCCGDTTCPFCGTIQRMNKDGDLVRNPYCYEKARDIPKEIGTDGFENFPDWCPLEVVP